MGKSRIHRPNKMPNKKRERPVDTAKNQPEKTNRRQLPTIPYRTDRPNQTQGDTSVWNRRMQMVPSGIHTRRRLHHNEEQTSNTRTSKAGRIPNTDNPNFATSNHRSIAEIIPFNTRFLTILII